MNALQEAHEDSVRIAKRLAEAHLIHEGDAAERRAYRATRIDAAEEVEYRLEMNRARRKKDLTALDEPREEMMDADTEQLDAELLSAARSVRNPSYVRERAETVIKKHGLKGEQAERVRQAAEEIINFQP